MSEIKNFSMNRCVLYFEGVHRSASKEAPSQVEVMECLGRMNAHDVAVVGLSQSACTVSSSHGKDGRYVVTFWTEDGLKIGRLLGTDEYGDGLTQIFDGQVVDIEVKYIVGRQDVERVFSFAIEHGVPALASAPGIRWDWDPSS